MKKRKLFAPSSASSSSSHTVSIPAEKVLKVEGIVIGSELFLRDQATNRVYASERDAHGELVDVGSWEPATKSLIRNTVLAPSTEPSDSKSADDADDTSDDVFDAAADAADAPPAPAFPYSVDADDHCETSAAAYADIAPLLEQLARLLHRPSAAHLRVYDPFYCAGAVVGHLADLGFTHVYNRCEDFYAVLAARQTPDYDVLVTNPPYSGDHIERLLAFCVASGKPWFVLVPNYVYRKPYYEALLAASAAADNAADTADTHDDTADDASSHPKRPKPSNRPRTAASTSASSLSPSSLSTSASAASTSAASTSAASTSAASTSAASTSAASTSAASTSAASVAHVHMHPFYVTPGSRYRYLSPAFLRADLVRARELHTSPFPSFWYVDVPPRLRDKLVKWWQRTQARKVELDPAAHPSLCTRLDRLPPKYMDAFDARRPRKRKNQRDAAKRAQLQRQATTQK